MKISKSLIGIAAVGIITVGIAGNALAWHPKGVIVKKVQNITTGSQLADADTAASAILAKPGDILKYVITIKNDGAADSKGYNDMANTVLTDALPAGVELVDNPANRTIKQNLGTIKPGKSVTKEFTVKVTANSNQTIENTACFTGNSTANDNPQKGCNPAIVTVTVPETPTTPETPEVPTTPEAPKTTPEVKTPEAQAEMPAELPKTGTTNPVFGIVGVGALWYAAHRFILSRK